MVSFACNYIYRTDYCQPCLLSLQELSQNGVQTQLHLLTERGKCEGNEGEGTHMHHHSQKNTHVHTHTQYTPKEQTESKQNHTRTHFYTHSHFSPQLSTGMPSCAHRRETVVPQRTLSPVRGLAGLHPGREPPEDTHCWLEE